MQFLELRRSLKDFTVFSLADIRALDRSFHRRRLNEWQDRGHIRKVIKGYYVFSDLQIDENVLFEIANKIYKPSYISFETALSYHGLIPESVYAVVSASTRRTYAFRTSLAEFLYRTVKPHLFFGYEIVRWREKCFKIADVEKAVLDYFYINTHIKTASDFMSVRLDKTIFLEKIDRKKFYGYLARFEQKQLVERMKVLWEAVAHA